MIFHKILAGCEEGSRQAWQAFLSNYTPVVFRIREIYVPCSTREQERRIWRESLAALFANDFARLRLFDHHSEREFVIDLRALVLDGGLNHLDPGDDALEVPVPSPDTVRALLMGLPLAHQVVVFLKLAGYSDRTLTSILRIDPAVAHQGVERLRQTYSVVVEQERDASLWPAAWIKVLQHAWSSKVEACPPLRQFVRILDGQTGWHDKEAAEKHVAECLHCLERWTALREVAHWLLETKPLPAEDVDTILSGLPVKEHAKARRPFLKRMFG